MLKTTDLYPLTQPKQPAKNLQILPVLARAAVPPINDRWDPRGINTIWAGPQRRAFFSNGSVQRLNATETPHESESSNQTLTTASKELNQQVNKMKHARHKIYPVVQLTTKVCLSPRCWGSHKRLGLATKACLTLVLKSRGWTLEVRGDFLALRMRLQTSHGCHMSWQAQGRCLAD